MSNTKKTILIIEDESPMRNALRDKFSLEGFAVLEAKNGEEGLKIALEKRPDLTLLDIIMPKVDGVTMLKELRQDDWGREAKVILLTNLSEKEKVAEAMEYGTFEYLVKTDWKIEDIIKKVRQELGMDSNN